MKARFSQVHWGGVLLTSTLVIMLAAILNTVLLLLASYVWGPRTLTVLLVHGGGNKPTVQAIRAFPWYVHLKGFAIVSL